MDNPNAEHILDYLRGYAAADPEGFARLAEMEILPHLARQELERRAARFLAVLPDAELAALATGQVILKTLIQRLQGLGGDPESGLPRLTTS
ncbi:hypothetical protein [Castellaniella sp. UC4442_H9]